MQESRSEGKISGVMVSPQDKGLLLANPSAGIIRIRFKGFFSAQTVKGAPWLFFLLYKQSE